MKEPFEQITSIEKDTISRYISSFAGCIPHDLKVTLQHWNKNKRTLWKILGKNLRVKIPIEIKMNDMLYERYLKELYSVPYITKYDSNNIWNNYVDKQMLAIKSGDDGFIPDFTLYIDKLYLNYKLNIKDINAIFWVISYANVIRGKTSSLFYQWFASNYDTCSSNTYYEINLNGKSLKITDNQKVIKLFQKIINFIGYNNINKFEKFRNKLSDISTKSSINTNLVLSIHPEDFMTMSDNNCGWSSCMSWMNKGGYSNGTIEMMNSNIVMVSYLESKTPFYFGNNDIPNKSWRALVYVHKDIIVVGKSYPYYNIEIDKTVLDEVYKLVNKNLKWKYQYKNQYYRDLFSYYNNESHSYEYLHSGHKRIIIYTNNMYNDLIEDKDHAYLCHRNYVNKTIKINASGKCSCMLCGKEIDVFSDGSVKYCSSCEKEYRCSRCNFISKEHNIHKIDVLSTFNSVPVEMNICDDCLDDYWYDTIHNVALLKEDVKSYNGRNNTLYRGYYYFIGEEKNIRRFVRDFMYPLRDKKYMYSYGGNFVEHFMSTIFEDDLKYQLLIYNIDIQYFNNPRDLSFLEDMFYHLYIDLDNFSTLNIRVLKSSLSKENVDRFRLGKYSNIIQLRDYIKEKGI